MGKPEREIAGYLKREVQKAGGKITKIIGEGETGVADYLIGLKGNHIVETKSPKGKRSPRQIVWQDQMTAAGALVWNVYTKEHVDEFIIYATLF